jgi:hypothetical protein
MLLTVCILALHRVVNVIAMAVLLLFSLLSRCRRCQNGYAMNTVKVAVLMTVNGGRRLCTGFFCPFIFQQTNQKGIHDDNPL